MPGQRIALGAEGGPLLGQRLRLALDLAQPRSNGRTLTIACGRRIARLAGCRLGRAQLVAQTLDEPCQLVALCGDLGLRGPGGLDLGARRLELGGEAGGGAIGPLEARRQGVPLRRQLGKPPREGLPLALAGFGGVPCVGGGTPGEGQLVAQRGRGTGEAHPLGLAGRDLLGEALRFCRQALDRGRACRRLRLRQAEIALARRRLGALRLEGADALRQLLLVLLETPPERRDIGGLPLQRRHALGQRVALVGERGELVAPAASAGPRPARRAPDRTRPLP